MKNGPPNPDIRKGTYVDPKTMTVKLPLVGTTTNFCKFGHPFERGGQDKQVAGILYIPHDIAADVAYLEVRLVKK